MIAATAMFYSIYSEKIGKKEGFCVFTNVIIILDQRCRDFI